MSVAGFLSEANGVIYEVGAGEHPVLQAALSHTGQGQGKQTPSRKQAASQPLQHHSLASRGLSPLSSGPCLLPGQCITCLPTAHSPATPAPSISSQHSARRTVTFSSSGFLIIGIVCAERSERQHMGRNSQNYSSAFFVAVGSDLGGHPSIHPSCRQPVHGCKSPCSVCSSAAEASKSFIFRKPGQARALLSSFLLAALFSANHPHLEKDRA